MATSQCRYNVYVSTDPGKVRSINEDNFVVNKITKNSEKKFQNIKGSNLCEPMICGVFDGMGGEAGGFEASRISATVATKYFEYLIKNNKSAEKSINSYVANCNDLIRKYLEANKLKRGGSTFAMAYFSDGIVNTFSLGDSRIYLLKNGVLTRISKDHTLAYKKYEANIYTKEEAEASPESHMLTKFLGMDEDNTNFEAECYHSIFLEENDKLLLCSDGLYDMCSENEICEILSKSDKPAAQLVTEALYKGGIDNVTCMVIERSK